MKKKYLLIICLFFAATFGFIYLRFGYNLSRNSLERCKNKIICPECNIILLSVDSFNATHIHALGYPRETTPFIDSLVKNSYFFSRYYTTSFLTPITQLSLFSSMYPSSIGVGDFFPQLAKDKLTLPQLLKKEGYYTQAFISSPEYIDTPDKESFQRGFDRYIYSVPRRYPRTKLLEKEIDNIKNNGKFFLWLTIGTVHWPYDIDTDNLYPDPNYDGVFKGMNLYGGVFNQVYKGTYYDTDNHVNIPLSQKDIQYVIDHYDDGVKKFDDFMKYFLNYLDKENLLDNTIIVLSSEHGESLYEYEYFIHYDILENLVHTPFIIITPNKVNTGFVEKLTSTIDIMPTILNLIGRSPPSQAQGESLVDFMCGKTPSPDDAVFIERSPPWEFVVLSDLRVENWKKEQNVNVFETVFDSAIRTERWKFIERSSKPDLLKISRWKYITGITPEIADEELYDLSVDPMEKNNVIDKYPEIAKTLRERLKKWQSIYREPSSKNKQFLPLQEYF